MKLKVNPIHLALGFIALGFLFILLGWNGAAGKECVDCQVPYVISGGIGGLAFIGLGAGTLLFELGRRSRVHLEEKIDVLIETLRETNGSKPAAGPLVLGGTSAIPNGMVVVGRSSFHRPDCRLVEGKEGLDYGTPEDAIARGLQPCRVCEPTREPTTPGARGRRR